MLNDPLSCLIIDDLHFVDKICVLFIIDVVDNC